MSGSGQPLKTSVPKGIQLPLKGFNSTYENLETGRKYRIEGMGDGRYRVHSVKRQPKQK